MTGTARRGRPPAASRQSIEDAASELFLEQGYAATSVDDVARRAGVSRSSFFNYFASKSDLLWVAVDDALAGVDRALEEAGEAPGAAERPTTAEAEAFAAAVATLSDIAVRLADEYPAAGIPWAITQAELMGTSEETLATGASRLRALERRVVSFMRRHDPSGDDVLRGAFAAAFVAAAGSAAAAWVGAGTERGPLGPLIERAVEPVCVGFVTAARGHAQ